MEQRESCVILSRFLMDAYETFFVRRVRVRRHEMDRSEWMYGMNRVLDPRYLVEVRKFIAAAKAHRERSKLMTTICPCSHCKNLTKFSL